MLSKVFYLLSICLRYKLRTSLLSRNYHIFLAIFGFVNAGNKMLELFKLSQRCSCLYLLLINCHTYSLTLHKMHQFAHTIAHFPFIYWNNMRYLSVRFSVKINALFLNGNSSKSWHHSLNNVLSKIWKSGYIPFFWDFIPLPIGSSRLFDLVHQSHSYLL